MFNKIEQFVLFSMFNRIGQYMKDLFCGKKLAAKTPKLILGTIMVSRKPIK